MKSSKLSVHLFWLFAVLFTSLGVQAEASRTSAEHQLMAGFPPAQERLVTKANWLSSPYNRYAYLHAREIFPSKPFERDWPVNSLTEEINGSLARIEVKGVNGEKMLLDDFLKQTYTDGFLVLQHGSIVYERYWNGATASTPHALFSITKSFTGTLVGILEERGLIDYEETVALYIPELKDTGYGDATIRQMMDMEVAVAWDESPSAMADPDGVFRRYVISSGFAPSAEIGSAYEFLSTMGKDGGHGEKFRYVAPVTDALGWLLERVSGKSYTQLLNDEIISRLGLESEGFMLLDGWGKALSTGGLNLTPRDLARFGLMIQNGGRFEGQRIVSEEFIADSRFNGNKKTFAKGKKDSHWLPGGAYRNQWWISAGDQPSLQAAGIYGQNLFIDPDAEVVIIRVASLPGSHDDSDELMTPLYQRITKILSTD